MPCATIERALPAPKRSERGKPVKIFSKTLGSLLLAFLALGSIQAFAADPSPEVASRILERLKEARDDLEYSEVTATPIRGLYAVQIIGGPTLYVSEDGEHFVAGDLFAIKPKQFVNVAELARAKERAELMAQVDIKDQIVFAPKGETKAVVHVFTDVDCGYCRKLHQEIDQFNALGIEVRYLAYPRAGVNSSSADKLATAWCASDRKTTMTNLKWQRSVPIKTCRNNPVAEHYRLGQLVGVNGTPNMVTEDGYMIGGYMEAEKLAAYLGIAN